jgi:serine-type D-Ala-D-Ala carboxypeptidase/endopeptidase (penicillin-binding protein 4)
LREYSMVGLPILVAAALWIGAPPEAWGQAPRATVEPGERIGLETSAGTRGLADAAPMAKSGAMMALRASLSEVLDHPARRTEEWSILAVSLDRGDTLFARSPDQPLAPASNMKLLTTAGALEYLGENHRFTTYMFADGPIRDGVLHGNLYLYGTGDPTLGTRFAERPAPALLSLADTLSLLGVREIRGDIVGDGSYFTGPNSGEGWQPDYMNAWYASPAGALSVHENLIRVEARPGEAGRPPELSFVPGGAGVTVRNEAVSGGGGGRARIVRAHYDGPILIEGRVGAQSAATVAVGDPAMYAAALFRDVLLDREIVIRGVTRQIVAGEESPITGRTVFAPALEPEGAIRMLAEHTSPPLTELLVVINHRSHNYYSEQVLRAVGRAATGVGSARAGAHALQRIMAAAGVDTASVYIADGCGLSPLNNMSAAAFIGLLAYMADSPMGPTFMDVLPVAGESPRFRRMGGTEAAGNLRAKTGTIRRVSALSGYVSSATGERIAFAIIGNNLGSVAQGKHIENVIGAQLAAFARTAPVAAPGEGVAAGE